MFVPLIHASAWCLCSTATWWEGWLCTPRLSSCHNRYFFFSLLHLHCPLTSLFPGFAAKSDIIYSPSGSIYPSLFCTIAPYLPWHTPCSSQTPLSCPKTFCLCFVPYLFLWSLFPILFPCLVTCSPNDVPDVSSCKAVFSSPCIPSEADFLLCIRTSPVFPPQRALYASSLFPSCPVGKSFCVDTTFLSEGFLLSCLYQSLCAFLQHPFLILTVWELCYLRSRQRRDRIKVLKDVSGCPPLHCLVYYRITITELLQA